MANCPYCKAKVEVKAGALRPHLVDKKPDNDRCDGSGLSETRLTETAGAGENVAQTGAVTDKP